MGTLFLAGGGSEKDSYALDKKFIEKIPKDKPLLYIPLAMEKFSYEECFQWIRKVFSQFHFTNIVMLMDSKKKINLQEFGAIYIGGGNTFKLLSILKNSYLFESLKSYFQKGGIIYGGSAGAIVLGKNILTSPDKNTYLK